MTLDTHYVRNRSKSRRWRHTQALLAAVAFATLTCLIGCEEKESAPAVATTSGTDRASADGRSGPSDAEISQAIRNHLRRSWAVPDHRVQLATADGIVTLSGSVESLLAKERAVEIAEQIRGVRSVVDQIAINPSYRTDEKIRRDILDALRWDPVTEAYEVAVAVSAGRVTLTGKVESWQERAIAAEVAKGVRGVTAVENEMHVSYPDKRPDEEIAADVRAALRRDRHFDSTLVTVSVDHGVVTLGGTVPSAYGASRAKTAAWVNGVQDVESEIHVNWWQKPDPMKRGLAPYATDAEIKDAIYDAYRQDPRVASYRPLVMIEGGVVTLTGSVGSLSAKQAAEDDALNTTGVVSVDNLLTVAPPAPAISDRTIESRVKRALLWSPRLYRYDIDVSVTAGKVYLTGTVPSRYDRQRAQDVVDGVFGVLAVENNLAVNPALISATSDWEVKRAIEDELIWSLAVDAGDVKVEVHNGIATLTGEVDSLEEWRAAEEQARQGGAWKVDNELEIKPPQSSSRE